MRDSQPGSRTDRQRDRDPESQRARGPRDRETEHAGVRARTGGAAWTPPPPSRPVEREREINVYKEC